MFEKLNKKYIIFVLFNLFILWFLYKVKSILLPFIIGFFIAYCFKNFVAKYENKFSRKFLSLLIILLFSFIFILITLFAIPIVFNQIASIIKEVKIFIDSFNITQFYNDFNKLFEFCNINSVIELKTYIMNISNSLLKYIGGITNKFITSSFQIVNIIFMICISPIVAFYFLRDWKKIIFLIYKFSIPKKFRKNTKILFERFDNLLHHYIIGQINVSLILGSFYSLMLFFMGFNYAFSVGIVSGLLTLLPYIGSFCGLTISIILGYFQFGLSLTKLLSIIGIFCLGQFLEGNFVTPNLIGDKIKVHPLCVIFGIFCGGTLYGFWGIILAMPIAGIIGVCIRFYFEKQVNNGKKI